MINLRFLGSESLFQQREWGKSGYLMLVCWENLHPRKQHLIIFNASTEKPSDTPFNPSSHQCSMLCRFQNPVSILLASIYFHSREIHLNIYSLLPIIDSFVIPQCRCPSRTAFLWHMGGFFSVLIWAGRAKTTGAKRIEHRSQSKTSRLDYALPELNSQADSVIFQQSAKSLLSKHFEMIGSNINKVFFSLHALGPWLSSKTEETKIRSEVASHYPPALLLPILNLAALREISPNRATWDKLLLKYNNGDNHEFCSMFLWSLRHIAWG